VKRPDLKPVRKIIDSTRACNKEINGTTRGRLNARRFKQIDGQHYNESSIHATVTDAASIRTILTQALMGYLKAEDVDVKGAFLKGEAEAGEEIHMTIPQGWEYHYNDNAILRLKSCLCGLRQAAMVRWCHRSVCILIGQRMASFSQSPGLTTT
jgi:hypothetical protein